MAKYYTVDSLIHELEEIRSKQGGDLVIIISGDMGVNYYGVTDARVEEKIQIYALGEPRTAVLIY